MHSGPGSDGLPGIGALIATQKRTYAPTKNKLPVVNFVKNKAKSKGEKVHSTPQGFLPPTPTPGKRLRRNLSPEQDGPGPSRPRKRRKLRDSQANPKIRALPTIELTSSDEEPKKRPVKAKSKANPRRTTPTEVIDLCSEPEDNISAQKLTQSRPSREEEAIILLTTDDEESNRPAIDADDRSPPTQYKAGPSSSVSQDPPTISTPTASLQIQATEGLSQRAAEDRGGPATPPLHEVLRPTYPVPSIDKEAEDDISAAEGFSGPLQDTYNEALRKVRLSEQLPITSSAFSCSSDQQPRYNTIVRHLGIFDSTSPQPPLLTPTFFMQVHRDFVSSRKSRAVRANGVCDATSTTNNQPSPSCLTHPGMMPARGSLDGVPSVEQSTSTRADAPRAVARTLENERTSSIFLHVNSAALEVPSSIPPDPSPCHEAATRSTSTKQRESPPMNNTCSEAADSTALSPIHNAPPAPPLPPPLGNQIEDNILREAELLGDQTHVREMDSSDDLDEILNMLLPKNGEGENDLSDTGEDLLGLELVYP